MQHHGTRAEQYAQSAMILMVKRPTSGSSNAQNGRDLSCRRGLALGNDGRGFAESWLDSVSARKEIKWHFLCWWGRQLLLSHFGVFFVTGVSGGGEGVGFQLARPVTQ